MTRILFRVFKLCTGNDREHDTYRGGKQAVTLTCNGQMISATHPDEHEPMD